MQDENHVIKERREDSRYLNQHIEFIDLSENQRFYSELRNRINRSTVFNINCSVPNDPLVFDC